MIPELQVAYNQLFRPAEPSLNIFSSGLVAPNCIKSPKPAKSKKLQWLGENRYNVCFVTLSIVFGTSSPLTMCGLGKYCYVFFVLLSSYFSYCFRIFEFFRFSLLIFFVFRFKELMQNRFVEIPALHQSGLYPRHEK